MTSLQKAVPNDTIRFIILWSSCVKWQQLMSLCNLFFKGSIFLKGAFLILSMTSLTPDFCHLLTMSRWTCLTSYWVSLKLSPCAPVTVRAFFSEAGARRRIFLWGKLVKCVRHCICVQLQCAVSPCPFVSALSLGNGPSFQKVFSSIQRFTVSWSIITTSYK